MGENTPAITSISSNSGIEPKQKPKPCDVAHTVKKGECVWNITKNFYQLDNNTAIWNKSKEVAYDMNNFKAGTWNHIKPEQIIILKDVPGECPDVDNSEAKKKGQKKNEQGKIDSAKTRPAEEALTKIDSIGAKKIDEKPSLPLFANKEAIKEEVPQEDQFKNVYKNLYGEEYTAAHEKELSNTKIKGCL